jgi:hypothetical protein
MRLSQPLICIQMAFRGYRLYINEILGDVFDILICTSKYSCSAITPPDMTKSILHLLLTGRKF